MGEKTKKIVVTGDVTIDWNFAIRKGAGRFPRTNVTTQPGGAALLADLLRVMFSDSPVEVVYDAVKPETPAHPSTEHLHSYIFFENFKREKSDCWRVSGFCGYNRDPFNPLNRCTLSLENLNKQASGTDVLILDDANFNFRDCNVEPLVKTAQWIILKTVAPIPDGAIWKVLSGYKEKLVVVISAEDLRQGGMRRNGEKCNGMMISRAISWERTCRDVMWELEYNPEFQELSQLAHIFVLFPNDGVIYRSLMREEKSPLCNTQLIFDPKVLEGGWIEQLKGEMAGYGNCFIAALVHKLVWLQPLNPDRKTEKEKKRKEYQVNRETLVMASKIGLHAMRELFKVGYQNTSDETDIVSLRFPIEHLSKILTLEATPAETRASFYDVEINPPRNNHDSAAQTILEFKYYGSLIEEAKKIVHKGIDNAPKGVPVGAYGKLKTVDRWEIESYNSVRNLIAEYLRGSNAKPLSIAVFGPPGSGKSFGVVQISKSIANSNLIEIEDVTFNLSQFSDTHDLIAAFHRIRDIGLKGKIPLVFWDEFDSSFGNQELFWLKFFLSPMQDGTFSEGEVNHWIGRCIFVFAGGTQHAFKKFNERAETSNFKSAKGPDFVSRLQGFLDISGIDPRKLPDGSPDPKDKTYPIRRAIVIYNLLPKELRSDGKLHVDPGVLNAFLETRTYRNGVRSMSTILQMCRLHGATQFDRSALPTEVQLDAHVDAQDFMRIVHRLVITEGQALERLAEAVHEVYRTYKSGLEKYKSIIDGKNHDAMKKEGLVPYAELSPNLQDSNRALAKSIPSKLDRVGYVMLPAREVKGSFDLPKDVRERMAVLEHERFVEERIAAGWILGAEKDNERKISPYLKSWEELDEEIREYDRVLFEGIPQMLSKLGYTVQKRVAE